MLPERDIQETIHSIASSNFHLIVLTFFVLVLCYSEPCAEFLHVGDALSVGETHEPSYHIDIGAGFEVEFS